MDERMDAGMQAMKENLERGFLQVEAAMEVEGGEPALMAMLEPPGCSLGISFQDHRFSSVWQTEYLTLDKPYSQKRLSRVFGVKRDWVRALQEVHSHNWKKWGMIKLEEPLAAGQKERSWMSSGPSLTSLRRSQ